MILRRSGNFGIVDTGDAIYSFTMGASHSWSPSSYMLNGGSWMLRRKLNVCGTDIIPMGDDNMLPNQVASLLDNFYAGEGILGKSFERLK